MDLIAGLGTEWNVTNERDMWKKNSLKRRKGRNKIKWKNKEDEDYEVVDEEEEGIIFESEKGGGEKEDGVEARRDHMCGRGGERQHPGRREGGRVGLAVVPPRKTCWPSIIMTE